MEMRHIDTVPADTLAVGDYIGIYDHDLQSVQPFEIVKFEDNGDHVYIECDWYDDFLEWAPDKQVKLFGY